MLMQNSGSWNAALEIVQPSMHNVVMQWLIGMKAEGMQVAGHQSPSCSTDRNADILLHTTIIITTISSIV